MVHPLTDSELKEKGPLSVKNWFGPNATKKAKTDRIRRQKHRTIQSHIQTIGLHPSPSKIPTEKRKRGKGARRQIQPNPVEQAKQVKVEYVVKEKAAKAIVPRKKFKRTDHSDNPAMYKAVGDWFALPLSMRVNKKRFAEERGLER